LCGFVVILANNFGSFILPPLIMPSLFTRIVNGEIPCHKVAETNDFLAFLDVFPCAPGHTLVIPKQEVDYIFDLEDSLYEGLRWLPPSKKPFPASASVWQW
jgi:HIT domain